MEDEDESKDNRRLKIKIEKRIIMAVLKIKYWYNIKKPNMTWYSNMI